MFEPVHHIDRQESQIDSTSLCTNANIAVTATRGSIGIWDILTGTLQHKLTDSALGAIVTHASITSNGETIVSAESGSLIYWNVADRKVIFKERQTDMLQVMIYDNETKCIAVSKAQSLSGLDGANALVISRTIPDGITKFSFNFPYLKYRNIVLTSRTITKGSSNPKYFVLYGYEKQKDTIFIQCAQSGTPVHKFVVKYPNFKEVTLLVAIPGKDIEVALIDQDKGNIVDVQNKKFVRSLNHWGGK